MTVKRPATRMGAYVSCLDCGKEFAYNWSEMRMENKPTGLSVEATLPSAATRPVPALSRLRLGS
jgi:hypothetical protein